MDELFESLKSENLKDLFVKKIENLIISGKLSIGEKLPSERELAAKMKISRTSVHSGIIELASKGLITIYPRKGTVINDYRKDGTLVVLESLMNYSEGNLEKEFSDSIISSRYLIEVEIAKLAALNRNDNDLREIKEILKQEENCKYKDIDKIVDIDFDFHHQLAISTKNKVYPLLIKSFEPVYKNLSMKFFSGNLVRNTVLDFHKKLYDAIEQNSEEKAISIMREILVHGESCLKNIE